MRALLLYPLLIMPCAVHAAGSPSLLFKCVGDHGETSYQQTACATPARALGTVEVADFGPPPARPASKPGRRQATATMPRSGAGMRRKPAAYGYACSGGGRSWVSRTPCPATIELAPRGGGRRKHTQKAPPPRQVAVRQRAVDRAGYCGVLRAQPASSESVYASNLALCR